MSLSDVFLSKEEMIHYRVIMEAFREHLLSTSWVLTFCSAFSDMQCRGMPVRIIVSNQSADKGARLERFLPDMVRMDPSFDFLVNDYVCVIRAHPVDIVIQFESEGQQEFRSLLGRISGPYMRKGWGVDYIKVLKGWAMKRNIMSPDYTHPEGRLPELALSLIAVSVVRASHSRFDFLEFFVILSLLASDQTRTFIPKNCCFKKRPVPSDEFIHVSASLMENTAPRVDPVYWRSVIDPEIKRAIHILTYDIGEDPTWESIFNALVAE
jgi:hypothetical protein